MSTVTGQADASNRFVQNSSVSSMPRVSSSPSTGVSNCYVFKSRLQEYAQKVGIPTPVYDTTKEGPSHQPYFRSTVVVNDIQYDSLPGFQNRKAAEQSAAEVALLELSKSGKINESISQPVHEIGLCKNLLQEYAQKMSYAIPLYLCHKEEVPGRTPLFKCTVEIGGILYAGGSARTKKEAEIKAARTALLALQYSSSDWRDTQNSEFVVVPCKRKTPETTNTPLKTASVPRLKKARPRKRSSKQKNFRANLGSSKGEISGNLGVIDGQSSSQLDKTKGSPVEGAEQLAVSETGNIRGENLLTNLNEDAKNILTSNTYDRPESGQPAALQVNHQTDFISFAKSNEDVKNILTSNTYGGPESGQPAALQVNHQTDFISFAKSNEYESKRTEVGMVVSFVDNATPAHAEGSNYVHGLTLVEKTVAMGRSQTTESNKAGAGMMVSFVDNDTPAEAEASTSVSGLTLVGEKIEVGHRQTTESKMAGAGVMLPLDENATQAQAQASNSVSGLTEVGEIIELGTSETTGDGMVVSFVNNAIPAQVREMIEMVTSQTTEGMTTGVSMAVSFIDNATPAQAEAVSSITPVGERIEVSTSGV